MKVETLEAVGVAAHKITLSGALAAFWAWLTSNETLGLLGATAALGGLAVTWYYKHAASKRQAAESDLRIQRERLRIQEQQMRVDLMRATGQPVPAPKDDSDVMPLGVD